MRASVGTDGAALETTVAALVETARRSPERYERLAVRWLARYAVERRPGLRRLHYAVRLLRGLGAGQGGAGDELLRLARPMQAGVSVGPSASTVSSPAVETSVAWRADASVVYDPGRHRWHAADCQRTPASGGESLAPGDVVRFVVAPSSCSACRPQVTVALSATADVPVRDRPLLPAASPPSRRRASAIKNGRMPGR